MVILISDAFDPSLERALTPFGEVTTDKGKQKEAAVILVRSKTKCTAEYIDNAPNLKLIVRGGVGVDNIDTAYASSKGIFVKNTPTASSVAVAETAFSLMLAVPSLVIEAHNSMKAGEWKKNALKRQELFGKTLCLVGMGNIAVEVAIRAKAFGMKVVAYRQSGRPSPHAEVCQTLEEALKEADYISLHTPLTETTRGMINKTSLKAAKDGAVLVNTGRADCIVPEDVKAALDSGKLTAYCTDVWPKDPPAEDYPLLRADKVLMAPHIGANSQENLLRVGKEAAEIVAAFAGGKLS